MTKFAFFIVILPAVLLFVKESVNSLTCRDEEGKAVDWFIVYKIPLLQKDPSRQLATGYSYAFLTGPALTRRNGFLSHFVRSYSIQDSWKLSDKLVTDASSIFGQTLAPLYDEASKYSFVMYNDQPPAGSGKSSSASLAHAKGVLALDSLTGFWMIHSVPQFASPATQRGVKYSYPPNGKENGQTAMCVSFQTSEELEHILTQLLCMRSNVYDIRVSDDISRISPKILDLKLKRWPKQLSENIQQISSIGGQTFTSFSRNSKSEYKDLYLEIVAPAIGSDLLVETWRRGAGDPLPSNCTYKYKVNNVETVELKFKPAGSTKETTPWSYLEDHSKWAVATDQPAACVGDINRMASQYKRGGGSMCLNDRQVWQIMKNSIHTLEGCPKPQRSAVPDPHFTVSGDRASSSDKSSKPNKSPSRSRSYLSVISLLFLTTSHFVSLVP